jgi:hypothetical protein
MKILTTSTEKQEIKIIPREYPDNIVVTIRNENTNITTTIGTFNDGYAYYVRVIGDGGVYEDNILISDLEYYRYDKGYMIIRDVFNLVENNFYNLTVTNGTDVIYKDKIFCSDQTINQASNNYFSVNKDVYTEEATYDNDYIIV